nr:putative GH32 family protein a [Neoseiulus cucumeris]
MSTTGKATYTEPFRPQFHFTPPSGWTNDPNGLVYHDGYWELFYQFNPDKDGGGHYKHWGHARSTDLFHWENLPVAISPYRNTEDEEVSIFSGSAVVDTRNVTKLAPPGANSTLLAFYTDHEVVKWHETQAMAYSHDGGITWTRFKKNPVIDNPDGFHDFRDPKVLEYNDKYIAVVATGDHVRFYESSNLLNWAFLSTYRSKFSGNDTVWECSDLFKLGEKWILLVNHDARTEYFVGDFDGRNFTPSDNCSDIDRRYLDYGTNSYAGVTYEAAPDGRRVFLSWMPGFRPYAKKTPTSPWRGSMSVPRELTLVTLENGLRLVASQPVEEISVLRKKPTVHFQMANMKCNTTHRVTGISSNLLDIRFTATGVPSDTRFGIKFSGQSDSLMVYYEANEYHINRGNTEHDFDPDFELEMSAPRLKGSATHSLRIVLDVSSVEVFVDEGLSVVSAQFFSRQRLSEVCVFFESGECDVTLENISLLVDQLQSAWLGASV